MLFIAVACLVSLNSCVMPKCGSITSTTTVNSNNTKVINPHVKGVGSATFVFGIGGRFDNSGLVESAKTHLLQRYPLKDGQALANVTLDYNTMIILGIYVKVSCVMTADIVEFNK